MPAIHSVHNPYDDDDRLFSMNDKTPSTAAGDCVVHQTAYPAMLTRSRYSKM
jgi:hypothetical protein